MSLGQMQSPVYMCRRNEGNHQGFNNPHSEGGNFLFADGCVHFVKETIDSGGAPLHPTGACQWLSTRDNGNPTRAF